MNSEIFKSRRVALCESLQPKEMAIVFAKPEKTGIEKFIQDNNFLYLTGLEIPEAILIINKLEKKIVETLFIQKTNPERIVWEGERMSTTDAMELSGIGSVQYLDDFYPSLNSFCPICTKIWTNMGNPALNRPLPYALFMLEPVRTRYPFIQINNINELLRPMRSVKSEWEIQQLQKAIDLTGEGLIEVIKAAKVGMMEYELEALLFYHLQRKGVKNWGFSPIVGSGINASTLHYEHNNCAIKEGDIVLMDVGAYYNNYSADITRCFPISGKFNARQKEVYQAVLDIQKKIIDLIKPGIGLTFLNEKTVELMAVALEKLGLITDISQVKRYYMHSIGHHIGMDTHDLGARDSILEIGNVITIEPGIYIPEESLGIRIEDVVLVTQDGYKVLSQNIPKEIKEIEALRKRSPK